MTIRSLGDSTKIKKMGALLRTIRIIGILISAIIILAITGLLDDDFTG